ncbi:hypothetical protein D3C72_644910 [compost metagenome]
MGGDDEGAAGGAGLGRDRPELLDFGGRDPVAVGGEGDRRLAHHLAAGRLLGGHGLRLGRGLRLGGLGRLGDRGGLGLRLGRLGRGLGGRGLGLGRGRFGRGLELGALGVGLGGRLDRRVGGGRLIGGLGGVLLGRRHHGLVRGGDGLALLGANRLDGGLGLGRGQRALGQHRDHVLGQVVAQDLGGQHEGAGEADGERAEHGAADQGHVGLGLGGLAGGFGEVLGLVLFLGGLGVGRVVHLVLGGVRLIVRHVVEEVVLVVLVLRHGSPGGH